MQENDSSQPNPYTSELNKRKESFCQLRISRCNSAILLEFIEKAFNKVPLFILIFIKIPRLFLVRFRWDAEGTSAMGDLLSDCFTSISLVPHEYTVFKLN